MDRKNTDINFERNKNLKALSYTIVVCGLLFLGFVVIHFPKPKIEKPIADEGIEVNLGDADHGLGTIQPESTNEPSVNESSTSTNSEPSTQQTEDVNGDEEVSKPIQSEIPKDIPKTNIVKPENPKAIATPKNPSPKATFPGSKTGGNNSNKNVMSTSQGNDFGYGDKGKPGGNPNSNSYNGNSFKGNNGLSIKSGLNGRKFVQKPSFKDEFSENAKVLVDVTVDGNGNVLTAIINPKGTTTTNSTIREIAKRKAREIKFNVGKDEDFGTILFDFKVSD